jgi:peptide/nickel transport system permease protein
VAQLIGRRLNFIPRLLLQVTGVAVMASVIIFLAVRVLPGDPARQILGRNAPAAAVAAKDAQLGLNHPLTVQYLRWLGSMVRGNLGTSLTSGQSVSSVLASTIPVSMLLVCLALAVGTTGGVLLGALAARKPDGWLDRAVTAYAALTSALPAFVWGLALVLVASLTLRLLPPVGYVSPFTAPLQGLRTIIMPVIALALPSMGVITRITRVTLRESLANPYITFARSKGISNARIMFVHALSNAAVPIVAIIATEFAYTLGDTVAVESVFAIPGVGQLLLNSFLQRDYAVIQGAVVVITVIVVLVTLLADVVAAWFDPRIRDQALAVTP